MFHNFRERKLIALILIVSQLIVNAGMQTFAVSFSKIVDNTLDAMQQPENISTKYYEEFYYESKTYLFNDGNEDNEDETNFDTANQNDEIENNNDDKENDGVGANETTVGASETTVGASTASPNEDDDDDEPDTQEYEEEPEEDTVEYEEEPEEDETDDVPIDGDYEDVPEEILDDETTVDETEEDVETTEESGASETRPYDDETEEDVETTEESGASETRPCDDETEEDVETTEESGARETRPYDDESEDNVGASTASPEEETTTEVVDIASDSEANDLNEETLTTEEETTETVAETETNIATTSEITNEDIELIDLELASPSKLMKFGGLLGATPVGGDGSHVHKICGVAEGAACLHTEVAEHTQVGDYRLIAADENEIMAEVIDDLIGRIDDGEGNYENITEPEYIVLGRDIEFDKSVAGNPRDADTTTDFYTINLVRDLYLCLNGHSIKNIRWTSSTNKQLFITNCGATAEVTAPNLPTNYTIFPVNAKIFGVNKNIIVRSGLITSLETAERCKSTFFGTIFDGYNTTAGVQYVFQITYDNASLVVTLEDCEFRNYKNDAGTAQAQALIRMNTKGTLILNNVKIHDNDGIQNHIFTMTNSSSIGKLTTRGRCEIYNNTMTTGTTPTSFLYMQRTTLTIEDEGLFVYNNSKTPGHCYANISANATVNIAEGATFSIDNNKLAKNTENNHTIFVYMAATVNARGNFYVTNNKIINCGTSNTGEALAGLWSVSNCIVNIGNGLIKIQDNKAYIDDCVNLADDKKYKAQHLYQVYGASKDTTEVFKMIDGYKFNPANRIGPVGFPSGQSGKIMKFTTDEVDDPNIVSTVFKVDTYYFKDYVVEVKEDYARAVHKESNHKHKECGVAVGEACTHQERAAHTEEIMYYELSGDLAISGRTDLIKGFSASDATEYFYLSDDIDNSNGDLISITLLRDVFICLNGHSMKGVRFAKGSKTVRICNCQNNTVTLRTASSGTEAYMFDCNAYLYGKQNKNIILNSYGIGRISSGYATSIYIYGTYIDAENTTGYSERSRAYVNKKNGYFKIENTDIHNSHTLTQVFMYVDEIAAGGFFTIRDVNVYDMSNLNWQIVRLKGKSGAEGTFTIKGNCTFHNINMANTNSNLVYADGYTNMTIDEGATLNLYNNNIQSGTNSLFAMGSANSKFRMKKDSKLIINNNILGKTTANQGFLLFNSSSHELLGDVIITNNSFYNCQGKTSDYIGAFLASKDANITIGSGKIFIDNNKAYLDEGSTLVDDRAVPQHHMYGFITGKTDLALVQSPGTKFSPETYIPNFAFMGYSAGTVAKWTENEYEEYYKASFSELIVADTTYTPDFKVVYEEDNLIVKSASTHFHKVCGVAETEACLHTEIDEHTENCQWSAARVDSVDAFVQSLNGTEGATGSSYYYLPDDIVASSITTITPKRDVYLCLNGHDMKGFKFDGTKSIYITNCTTDLSTIENTTTNLTFQANTYLYGINKNIFFHTNRLCNVSNDNVESHIYSITVDGTGTDTGKGDYATLWTQNNNTKRSLVLEDVIIQNISGIKIIMHYAATNTATKVVMKNTEVKNCATFQPLIHIENQGAIEFKGKNTIHDNKHTSDNAMLNLQSTGEIIVKDEGLYVYDNETTGNGRVNTQFGKKFSIAENATLSFVRNKIKKNSGNFSAVVFVEDAAELDFKGNFEVRDNKIVNAGTQTNNFCAGVYILAKNSIKLGNGRVIIKDNKCYKDNGVTLADDTNYVAQHMFNLLTVSKDVNLFSVTNGYKLNPETRVEGAAFYSASGTGKIVDWNSSVTDDLNAYRNMFVADKFFNPILDRKIKNNTLVLDYDANFENAHNHKICGVSTRSACTHTIFENHTEGISYKPLSGNLVKDTTIFITLLTDQLGSSTEPNYFYLTTDLIGSTGEPKKIQFDVDTYICLNGHTIRGYEMQMKSGKFMNITNCSPNMGSIRLDIWGNLPFSTNTRVYGINKNITLNTPRLCSISTKNNEYYSVILDPLGNSTGGDKGSYHVINAAANSKLMIEDFEFRNIVKAYRLINVSDGVANTDFVFKNVTVTGSTATWCPFYFGNQTTCKIDIYEKFDINNNDYRITNAGGGLFDTNAAKVTIHDGATLSISDNTVSNRGGIFHCDKGNVTVEAGGKFSVSGNKIYKNTNSSYYSGNTEIVYIGGSQNFSVFGDLAVVDNKIVNCGTNSAGSYMSALSLYGTNNSIVVGNGNLTVENNKAFSNAGGTTAANDTTYKNHHLFQVYSYNTKLVFKQADGTKFNTSSRMTVTMQGISEGKVAEWNANTTDNISAYSTVFKTDYFGDEDPMLVVYKNDSVQLVSSSNYHFHKICGAATSSNCSHTLVTTRHENVEFSRLGTSINADSFVSLIKGVSGGAPEYFYLRGDITSSSEKEIAIQRDVYLCLNGHSISGFRFTGKERKIYICNCRDNKVSTIKNVLSSNVLFTTNVQIYGSTRSNVVVNSGRIVDVHSNYKNDNCAFYNVNFNASGAKAIKDKSAIYFYSGYTTSMEECIIQNFTQTKAILLTVAGGAVLNAKNVTMKNNSNVQYSVLKVGESNSGGTLNINGYFDITNNTANDGNHDVFICVYGNINIKDNARLNIDKNTTSKIKVFFGLLKNSKLTAGENSYFGITRNTMEKATLNVDTGFFYLDPNAQDITTKGDFIVENNKVYNCGTSTTGTMLYAVQITTNRYINVGNGKIRISGNTACKDGTNPVDDKTYKNQHMYQTYANFSSHKTNGLIKVLNGYKFNTESRIEGLYYDAYNYNGNVIKWDSTTVDDADINRFSEMFTADAYKDDELSIGYDATNGWVIIEYGAPKHRHKLCGVATTSDCAHTAAASHGDNEVGYRKLTKDIDRSTLTSSLAQGGAFVLLDDIDPATIGDGGAKNIAVTVSNDLYLCLNGHSLKGITFTGGPAKSIFITNCSTKKGTFENTVNSVAAFTNISAEINGINKNIDVLYDRLAYMNGAASNNQRIRLYSVSLKPGRDVKIDDSYIYITQNSNYPSSIEDCDFENMNAYSLFRSDGVRTLTLKNNTFKNMTLRNFFMSFDKGATKLTFEGNNVVDNIKYANEAADYFIHLGSYAGNEVAIDGNLTMNNNESYYNSNHFFHIPAGKLNIKENSKLTMNNNKLYNTAIQSRAILYTGDNVEVFLMGSLEIKDNAFIGTRQSHSDFGFRYGNAAKPVKIGSTSIVITNNTTTNKKANVRDFYSYYSAGALEQTTGTKFNVKESRIDRVAINSEDYTGEIYNTWNRTNVMNFDDVTFDEVFGADDYAGRKGIIVAKFGEKIIITFGDHFHKVCGTLATESCVHPGIEDHGLGTSADVMKTYLALRWGNMNELKSTLEAGGTYFLIRKIKFDTPTVIDVRDGDLILCLKGFYIENAIFTSSTGKKIYISTCVEQIEQEEDEEEEIEYDDDGNPILSPTSAMGSKRNDRNEVALVATASGVGTMFNSAVEIYSPHRLLNIYANKLYESSNSGDKVILSGVNLHNDEKTANGGDYIDVTGENEITLNNVIIATMSNVGYVVKSDKSTLNLSGDTEIYKNTLKKGLFDAHRISQVNGSVKIHDNYLVRQSGEQNFIKISTGSELYGELEAINNKVIYADDSNNAGRVSILSVASPAYIRLRNTKMHIEDNYAYSDGGNIEADVDTYLNHYVYGIFSNNFRGIFRQDEGTSMDASSRVNVSFAEPKHMGTVVKDWTGGDECENIFIADHNIDAVTGYNREKLHASLDGGDVVIDNKVRIYFKEGKLEKMRTGISPISYTEIAYYGEPYMLRNDIFEWKFRHIKGYVDEYGKRYQSGYYPTGLVSNRGKIVLTALWSDAYAKDDWDVQPFKEKTKMMHEAVIVGGEWQYNTNMRKWMYYLDGPDHAIKSLFAGDDAELYMAMSGTDLRGYMRNGIYQIYWNGAPYYFKFDENGYMVTGLCQIDGDYYYFTEDGILKGAMQFAPMTVGNKKYIFDVYGRIVREQDITTGEVQVLSATYQKMIGMDDYYDPIPSLVGWN